MGGIWIAMRIAMASSPTPDCRGGVFAVFAKISPPTCPPCARTLSAFSLPCGVLPYGHVGAGGLCSDVACRVPNTASRSQNAALR